LKGHNKAPQSLLFSRLNSLNSLSLSSQERCSSPLIIFVALLWSRFNRYMIFGTKAIPFLTYFSKAEDRRAGTSRGTPQQPVRVLELKHKYYQICLQLKDFSSHRIDSDCLQSTCYYADSILLRSDAELSSLTVLFRLRTPESSNACGCYQVPLLAFPC